MSGQGSGSARSFSSGNAPQAPQQPQQHSPMFNEGQALFEQLQGNRVQVYRNFTKLDNKEMAAQIDALQFWRNRGGPQNQDETQQSRLFLQNLKEYRQQEVKRKAKLPWFLFDLTRLCQLGLGLRSQSQRQLTKKKQRTVSYEKECSLSQAYGLQHNLSDGVGAEQEEKRPLKQQ